MLLNLLLLSVELFVLGGVVLGLHHLRSRYGLTLLLIFLGSLSAVVQLFAPLGVFIQFLPNVNLTMSSHVIVPAILLGVLLIYATEGTASARIAIWGIVAVILLVLFALYSLYHHLDLPGGGSFVGLAADTLILRLSARRIAASIIAFIADMYILAILYQTVINRFGFSDRLRLWNSPPHSRAPIWLATIAALLGTLWTDALIFSSLTYAGTPGLAEILPGQLIGKTISGILLWPMTAIYLSRAASNLPDFEIISRRRSFDMLFGSYGQLENSLARSEETLLRRVDELAAIHAISLEITTSRDLTSLLEKIVESATRLLAAPVGGMYLCDAARNEVRCVVSYHTPADYTGVVLEYGEGSAGVVAQTGEPLIINDYRSWSGRAAIFDDDEPFTAVISAPLTWHGQVTGVLHVLDNADVRQFTPDDLKLLTLFANQAAVSLENARLLVETNEMLQREKRLTEITRTISGALHLPTVLREIVRLSVELLNASAGAIALVDPVSKAITYPYLYNMPESLSEKPAPESLGLAREIIETGRSVITGDYPHYHSAIKEWVDAGLKNVLGVPVSSSGDIIGALGLFNFAPEWKSSDRDRELAEAVGRQAGVAIQNARLFADSQRQMQELSGLFDAALDTSSVLEVDILLDRIYQQIVRLFAPDSFAVVLYDSDTEELCVALAMEEHQKLSEWMSKCFPLNEGGLSSWVIQNRRYLLVRDMERDLLPVQPRHGSRVARSWLGVPLVAHDRILGMISVQSFEPEVYDDRHRRLLETLATQVAIALVNAQYATDLEKNLNELSALYDLAQKTASSLDAEEVLHIAVHSLKEVLAVRAVSVALLDPDTGTLTLGDSTGVDNLWIKDFRLKVGEGVSGMVVETGQSHYVPDTHAVPDFKFFSRDVRSLLVVPLKAKDRIIGTLSIDSDEPNAFTEHDEHLSTIAASHIAVAIENAKLFSEVQQMAITDGLTGVANRRAFDIALQNEVMRAIRYGHPLSLIFLDIDDFKIFNDTYGHPAGDEQLKEIAKILSSNVRHPDMVARYGGEEFVLLLPHTSRDGACNLAERIRVTAVTKARESLPGKKITLKAGSPIFGYTVSIGVAAISDDAQTGEELLHAADWAVLEAKRTGKNRVCTA